MYVSKVEGSGKDAIVKLVHFTPSSSQAGAVAVTGMIT